MPFLSQLFMGLFGGAVTWLLGAFTAKVAVRVAGAATMLALATGLFAAFNLVVGPWVGMVFDTQYGQFLGLLFPPIAGTVLTSLMGLFLGVKVYQLQQRVAAMVGSV